MTTPTGQISLNDVNVELGLSGTTLISMNQTSVRTLAGVASGAISMQNLQGKSNRVTANITISSDTANYTLNTAKVTGYSAGKTDVTLTINSGVVVYSGSTGSYAFTVDTSWASGDTVTIVNNGTILGKGGNGGGGGSWRNDGSPGSGGGPALYVQRATSINNVNRIAGGGGGGGGGGSAQCICGKTVVTASGGSGGGGIGNGSPGGSLTSAGGGSGGGSSSCGGTAYGGSGGSGGGYGSSGNSGSRGSNSGCGGGGYVDGGGGGSAGAAVAGNSNITWIATGTRNGAIT
jgi:hypothetical protein